MVALPARQIINEVKKQYNTIAKEWDISRVTPSGIKDRLINVIKPKDKVLDLGCGNGLILPAVLKRQAQYFGLDISRELVRIAKKKYAVEIKNKQAKFVVADATGKLPYRTGTFSEVLSFAVLHHVPGEEHRLNFLKEIKRVLRPGGTANIIVWNILNDWPKKRFEIEKQLNANNDYTVPWKATDGAVINRYIHCFNASELRQLSKRAGFSQIKSGYYNRAGKKEKNGEELVLQLTK